jgi:hypothetical protein
MTGRGGAAGVGEGRYVVSVVISFCAGSEGIFHECGDGHGAYAAGYRGDIAANGAYFFEVDVSFQGKAAFFAGIGDAGDADVDDDGAFFDHGGVDEFRFAQGGDYYIALQAYFFKVVGMGVANGDGAVAGVGVSTEEDAHGAADDVAAADYYCVFAAGIYLIVFEEEHDPIGGGRDKG